MYVKKNMSSDFIREMVNFQKYCFFLYTFNINCVTTGARKMPIEYMFCFMHKNHFVAQKIKTGPSSAVSNMSGNRCESECRCRGHKFDPGPVPYFRGD